MKSLTGNFSSVRGWALLLALLLGAGLMISACGDEEVPAPTTPTPAPAPAPPPAPEPTGPATPENLRVSASTSTSITWTWDAVEGALGYQGQFSPDATFTDADPLFGPIIAPQTSYTVERLSANMTGHFRVRSGTGTSLTDLAYSEWTDAVSGSTAAPPPATALSAPTGLQTSDREDDSITLSWNEVDDAGSYEVQQQADGASGWSAASCGDGGNEVPDTECVASGLEVATAYNFRVRAAPADDDDAHTVSDWTETSSSVSTTGVRTPDTSSMGEGDLSVTWKSTADTITWEWELTDNRDHIYQVMVLTDAQADIDDKTPCPKPTASVDSVNWDTGSVDRRRHPVTGASAGDVQLLCVQTMWEDENDVAQYGNLSWAWAATSPPAPTAGAAVDDDKGKTTELTWQSVAFDPGFKYAVTLATDTAEEGAIEASQGGCKNGTDLGSETTDISVALDAYKVTRFSVYTSNRLCYRAENSSGASAWAIGTPVYSLPAAPNRPSAEDSTLDHDQTGITWRIASKAGVPRTTAGYNFVLVTDVDQADRNSPGSNARFCTDAGDDNPAKFSRTAITTGLSTTQDGVEVAHTAGTNSDTTNPKVYHLCVQGEVDSRGGPWVLGGTVTQAKAPS